MKGCVERTFGNFQKDSFSPYTCKNARIIAKNSKIEQPSTQWILSTGYPKSSNDPLLEVANRCQRWKVA